MSTDDLKSKLEVLRQEALGWTSKDEERSMLEEIGVLEREKELRALLDRFGTGGPQQIGSGTLGVDFVLIPSAIGGVVLKLADTVPYKKFRAALDAAEKDTVPFEALHEFVLATVAHPAREVFIAAANLYPGLPRTCMGPALALHEGVAKARAGKS